MHTKYVFNMKLNPSKQIALNCNRPSQVQVLNKRKIFFLSSSG